MSVEKFQELSDMFNQTLARIRHLEYIVSKLIEAAEADEYDVQLLADARAALVDTVWHREQTRPFDRPIKHRGLPKDALK